MSYAPVSGNDGRVKKGTTAVAGLNKWSMVKKTTAIKNFHFESPTDADGLLWLGTVLRGTSEANVTFSGSVNTDATDATDSGTPGLSNGLYVTMDFILVKATPWGFLGISVFIEQVSIGTGIGQEAATFEGSGDVVGVPKKTGNT
jgi:hypothetical protein